MINSSSENMLSRFLKQDSAPGILLMVSAAIAIIVANTPLYPYYDLLIDTPVAIQVGTFEINKPLLLWINDGLMAIFFLMVGLELKYELLEGELSDRRKIALPLAGAFGGMFVPALCYYALNSDSAFALQGWAIPAATDIAFALGVLVILGSRVPVTFKIFLASLAIFDDVGAVVIIALFYTDNISLTALAFAALCCCVLFVLNRKQVADTSIFLLIGLVMWVSLLKSGVHATLAGVALAMFIPHKSKFTYKSPLKELEHSLAPAVSFLILPIFAFANAGVSFIGMGIDSLLHPIPLGIAAGLFIGKQIGVFGCCWLAIKLGFAELPKGMRWSGLYGISALCGIGFTMSLFISGLAFEQTGVNQFFDERLGILFGSLLSGILGYSILRLTLKPNESS
ncbi:Na+/H+ antiporter NhaA [Aurantivibrio plasticivorans]